MIVFRRVAWNPRRVDPAAVSKRLDTLWAHSWTSDSALDFYEIHSVDFFPKPPTYVWICITRATRRTLRGITSARSFLFGVEKIRYDTVPWLLRLLTSVDSEIISLFVATFRYCFNHRINSEMHLFAIHDQGLRAFLGSFSWPTCSSCSIYTLNKIFLWFWKYTLKKNITRLF